MKPQEVTISVGCNSNSSSDEVTEYIATRSSTLVNLNVIEYSNQYNLTFSQPMTALRTLHFQYPDDGHRACIRFENFNYATHLPALESLILSVVAKEDDWIGFFSSTSTSMKRMTLPLVEFTNLDLATTLHQRFPNLIDLSVGLYPTLKHQKVLETLFSTMQQLKSLKIYGYLREERVWIDHVLTGYSKEDCRQMRSQRLFLNSESIEGITKKPSLTDLTLLENFELTRLPAVNIDFLPYSTPYSISDVTGYLAFLKMPKLKKIKIIHVGLTKTCIKILKSRLDVEFEMLDRYTGVNDMVVQWVEPTNKPFNYDDYDSPTPPTYFPCFEDGDDAWLT